VGKRWVAVAVVVASACTALQYSTTSQQSVVIANNPYHFSGAGSQTFVVSPAGSGDHDILQQIYLDNCASQWSLYTTIDPQQPVAGAHVCGFGGSAQATQSDLITCPRNYQFLVGFAATQPGLSSCNVRILSMDYNGSGSSFYTLTLSGSGSGIDGITVSPSDINFGDVQINTISSPSTITVKNNGSAFITVAGSGPGAGFVINPNPGSFSISPGSSAFFAVSCNPTAIGPISDQIDFSSGSSSGSTKLSCNGIDSTVTIQPTQINFDNTLVGRAPPQESVQIGGNGTAMIESVTLDADAIAAGVTIVTNPQGMTIGAGKNIVLAYDAAAMHAAGPLGSLAVKVSSDAAPRNVSISGQALLGGIGTNPASIEFGAVCVNDSLTKDVEVYASEAGDVTVMSLTKPATPFDAMAVDALPRTLAGNHTGASATMRVTLAPKAPGDFIDAFALSSDVPNKPTVEVQLHGVGVADGIAATPDVVHFGTASLGTTTSIQQIQLTNCGASDLMFNRATITGTDAADFTLIGANPPRNLLPTESEVFMVVMQPETSGFKSASLVIEHSAGTTTAALDGSGEGGSLGERETYYACSTGRGGALWPVAFALLLLRRRRRTTSSAMTSTTSTPSAINKPR
jgi:hypothetical protein